MRLDRALVERRLARSRGQSSDLIGEGVVTVNGQVVTKAATQVEPTDDIAAVADPYVSRAAHKLIGALDDSLTRVPSRVLDAGASTGGFTQVVLERGAARVYAVDVGHRQLARHLRDDPRVAVREGLNLRDVTLADIDDEPVDLIVGDVSFISLTVVLHPMLALLNPTGIALLLIKPQFEVGRVGLGGRGVVSDQGDRDAAVARVVSAAEELGWSCDWRGPSRRQGRHGNAEYFVRLHQAGPQWPQRGAAAAPH
jgi:23S rRNA (cytidine1920-2'-O)/16S rRNA (cytidine1409-2'-O)-methyltransferase